MSKAAALLLAAALAISGLFFAPAVAAVASETPLLTVTEAPRAGGIIVVSGSGFDGTNDSGIYLGVGPAGLPGFYAGAAQLSEVVAISPDAEDGASASGRTAKLNGDGTFTVELEVAAYEEGNELALYTSKGHGLGFGDKSQDTVAAVIYEAEEQTPEVPGEGGDEGSGETEGPGEGEGPGEEPELPVIPVVPSVEIVGDFTELDRDGENIVTVRGTGFVADAPATSGTRPPLAGKFAGAYVIFGSFADVWQPSLGAPGSARSIVQQRWAVPAESYEAVGGSAAGAVVIAEDGTFESELSLKFDEAKAVVDGSWGVVTFAGGGAKYAPFETFTKVTFKDEIEIPEVPEVPVLPETPEVNPEAGTLTWGFKNSWNYYFDNFANGKRYVSDGAAIANGTDITFQQATESTYKTGDEVGVIKYQGTVVYQSVIHGFTIALANPWVEFTKQGAQLTAMVSTNDQSGTQEMRRIKVATLSPGKPVTDKTGLQTWSGVTGVFDSTLNPEGWHDYRNQDIAPLTFSYGSVAVQNPEKPNPIPPLKPGVAPGGVTGSQDTPDSQIIRAVAAEAGSLVWGISQEFLNYVTGPISQGSIATTGVGSVAGSFLFPQAVGSQWNTETETGTVLFSGAVTLTGHRGLMVETFANPVITVHNADTATLSVGGRSFSLDLANANKAVGADGELTWTGVAVYGDISGAGGGGGGTFAADPLSFTVGSAASTEYAPSETKPEQKKNTKSPAATVTAKEEATVAGAAPISASADGEGTSGATWAWIAGILMASLLAAGTGALVAKRTKRVV